MRLEQADELAILHMEAGRANAIDHDFLDGLERLMDELAASGARAGVLTGYGRYFSAGLALPELIALERDEMREFMTRFSDVMERVFAHPGPLVAAINGWAIAGGCVLALQCDFRVMSGGPTLIGLNEAVLGVGLPPVAVESLRSVVSPAERLVVAQRGAKMAPKQAQVIGLVDDVVLDDQVLARAMHHARLLGAIPAEASAQIKEALRQPALERMRDDRAAKIERWLDTWFSPETRRLLQEAAEQFG